MNKASIVVDSALSAIRGSHEAYAQLPKIRQGSRQATRLDFADGLRIEGHRQPYYGDDSFLDVSRPSQSFRHGVLVPDVYLRDGVHIAHRLGQHGDVLTVRVSRDGQMLPVEDDELADYVLNQTAEIAERRVQRAYQDAERQRSSALARPAVWDIDALSDRTVNYYNPAEASRQIPVLPRHLGDVFDPRPIASNMRAETGRQSAEAAAIERVEAHDAYQPESGLGRLINALLRRPEAARPALQPGDRQLAEESQRRASDQWW